MNSFDRLAELWTDYLEGTLRDEEAVELTQLIELEPERMRDAIEHYQIHRTLGLISKTDSNEFVRSTISRLPASSEDFVSQVLARIDSEVNSTRTTTRKHHFGNFGWRSIALSVAISAGLVFAVFQLIDRDQEPGSSVLPSTGAMFTNTARTKFLGSYAPALGSTAVVKREYILTSGSVQLRFPTGAEAIVEGPAVFQIVRDNHLQVSVGRCSVYCPAGAEGFVVDTPNAYVVDRGTRFFVNVAESSATEVHVIDGAADIYRLPANKKSDSQDEIVRLNKHQAVRFDNGGELIPQPTDFESRLYQSRLPDRVLSYQATQEAGGAKDLTSVRVQRNGEILEYSAKDLIGAQLVWFKIAEKIPDMRHLAGDVVLPDNRSELLSDLSLNTGVINPGGSRELLRSDPVMRGPDKEQTTPGFAVQFVQPVVNCPGPDVLFFELQDLPGDPDGDSFHVMPLQFSGNRKSLAVEAYDLTLTSPEVQRPANFYLHEFEQPVDSLDQLLHAPIGKTPKRISASNYRILVVAIDLTSLGFADGESAEGLFFQDSLDNQHHVDPVAIFGLPSTL